ncbi:DUF6247 family protein [Streptomyces nojiriensis]|uniref:DUF6247 family protein n=1 Tax=Streptomyces nojiriensis TaxID=66374 RepID=UPI002E183909
MPAFERDWTKALEDARHAFSLTPLHEVVRTWQLRVAAAPDVDAFMDSGQDDSGSVDLTTSSAAARDRRAAVGGVPVPAGREDPRRTPRPGPGDGPRRPGHRGALPVGLAPVERRRPEGEDVRVASVGQLSVVYVVNRLTRCLSVLGVVWLG